MRDSFPMASAHISSVQEAQGDGFPLQRGMAAHNHRWPTCKGTNRKTDDLHQTLPSKRQSQETVETGHLQKRQACRPHPQEVPTYLHQTRNGEVQIPQTDAPHHLAVAEERQEGRRGEKDFFFRQPRQRNPGCLSERGWEGPSFMVRVSWKYCDIGERLLY